MPEQSGAVIQRQIKLPFSQAFKISLRNITLRLGRAAVTAASIFLAIAFLSSVLATKVIQDTLERERRERGRVLAVGDEASPAGSQANASEGTVDTGGGEGGSSSAVAAAARLEETGAQEEEARRWWLVAMSLLVCLAGITNAMLMSVTERFREIGTMKCLGALDSFIVRLFLIESTLLGVLGSAIGAIVGAMLILFVYSIREGFSLPARINWPELLVYMGASIGVGAVIALLAAIAPAIRAARLPPAAALRTEI
jgi:putative ABC transport system permease protein